MASQKDEGRYEVREAPDGKCDLEILGLVLHPSIAAREEQWDEVERPKDYGRQNDPNAELREEIWQSRHACPAH